MREGTTFRVNSSGISSAVDIAIDSVDEGGQSLIFAETRKRCLPQPAAEGVYKRLETARELTVKTSSEILARMIARSQRR